MQRDPKRRAQLRRTLQLMQRLQEDWCPLPELVTALQVSDKTIRRDIGFLQGLGFPIEERTPDISDSGAVEWICRRPADAFDRIMKGVA